MGVTLHAGDRTCRLGPARLAHCMRWIAQAETALDMMVDRSLNRFSHGSLLAEKQGIQWMIADSSMEIYQAKLTVLMRCTRCASRNAQSLPTPTKGRLGGRRETFRSDQLRAETPVDLCAHVRLGFHVMARRR